mmetsp:Transcript_25050/g.37061  ORF Transcript_25050/g.37061 Transcript_25050/m.37061 type:complete len:191 (+) Transcript_25050:144-716(+)
MFHRIGTSNKTNSMGIYNICLLLFVISIALGNIVGVAADAADPSPPLTSKDIEDVLKVYGIMIGAPNCQTQEVDNLICPKDQKVPCGDISEIKAHCANLLGPDVVSKSKLSISGSEESDDTGSDAYAGCINYVSFFVNDKFGCCESEWCEEWLEAQFDDLDAELGDNEFDDDAFDDYDFNNDESADRSEF